jgi:hypothetical protein
MELTRTMLYSFTAHLRQFIMQLSPNTSLPLTSNDALEHALSQQTK